MKMSETKKWINEKDWINERFKKEDKIKVSENGKVIGCYEVAELIKGENLNVMWRLINGDFEYEILGESNE